MTDVPPPESPKPPRGRPRRPKGYDDEAVLSEEEVQRRVDVRGGGAPRAPIERAPIRERRVPVRPQQRTGARDGLLLIGLVIVGLVAVRLFLPDGPLTASATSSPDATQAAVATDGPSVAPGVPTPAPTGGVITLPPTPFVPTPSPAPITEPPFTEPPAPTPTLKPGQTPAPTPKPTKTPTATVLPSSTPSTPGTATVIVIMHVVNDNGGDAQASDWTMNISGEVGSGVSKNNFPGQESPGTAVTITAGKGFLVTDDNAVAGYSGSSPSADCHHYPGDGLAPGEVVTCTITRNDRAARVNVTINYFPSDATPPEDPVLSISGADASPTTVTGAGTVAVTLDSNASWSVEVQSTPTGWTPDHTGTCSSSGLNEGQTVNCTYTFTQPGGAPQPFPAGGLPFLPFLPLVLPRQLLPRRWRSNRAG